MIKMVSHIFVALGVTLSAYGADVAVRLDTSFAKAVLADVCSGNPIDETAIRQSPDVHHMLKHFLQFRDYFTMDAYIAARQKAAMCEENERDYFRFNELVERREALMAEVEELAAEQKVFSDKVANMLAPYIPSSLSYDGRAVVAVGTPSCGGWSVGQEFFVDLPCIKGDAEGMQYLIAHETYHGMQNLFMEDVDEDNQIAKLFNSIVREGTATGIADFTKVESDGAYSALSKRILRANARRVQSNFDLLEMSINYLVEHDTPEGYDVVNNIGISGSFDAPFYSVGALVMQEIQKKYSAQYVVCLMQTSPFSLFEAYLGLQHQDETLPRLGAQTSSIVTAAMIDVTSTENCEAAP